MKISTRIAIRHLRSRHNFGFISFSVILSIIGLSIGISSLIIISCISNGFSNVVNSKLSAIDGHLRISNYLLENIPGENIEELESAINNTLHNIKASSPYIEKHAIVRNGSLTEGIIVYGVTENSLIDIFQLNHFTTGIFNFNVQESIIIGRNLAHSLNVKIGDDIIIMDIEKMSNNQILKAKSFTVIDIFKTDFPEYDRLLTFIPIHTANVFFEMNNAISGLMINVDNPDEVDVAALKISEIIGLYPYLITSWKERHSSLLEWLTIYDIPIKLIMIFITIVGIFNIGASLWMIIIEKTRDFGIMKSMGLSSANIKLIILKQGALIGLLGSFGGLVISGIILYLQGTYHFIHLSNEIYFMDHLPVKLSPIYFFIYPLLSICITIAFSYYPSLRAAKISPSEALRYE